METATATAPDELAPSEPESQRDQLAADTVSRPQEFMLAKRFVAEKIPVRAAELADDSVPLKSLLPAV